MHIDNLNHRGGSIKMAKKTLILITIVMLWLNGCANTKFGRAEQAERAKTELLGKTKAEIMMCAGVPVRSEKVDNYEFITYLGGGDSDVYETGEIRTASIKKRYCEVTFAFQDGVVVKINYSGRTGGLVTKGEQCAFVVQNCLTDN